jgi:hypothetical protein
MRADRMRGWAGLAAAVTLMTTAGVAEAAPRPFAFTYDADTGAEGDADVEQWLDWWRPGTPPGIDGESWDWWLGGAATPIDGLQVASYVVAIENEQETLGTTGTPPMPQTVPGSLRLQMLYFLVKYRFVDPSNHALVPFVQLEYCLPFNYENLGVPHLLTEHVLGARLGAEYHTGPVRVVANLVPEQTLNQVHSTDVGWNLAATWVPIQAEPWPPLTVGAEGWGYVRLSGPLAHSGKSADWAFLGPSLGYSKGRFWATLSVDYGLTQSSASHGVFSRLILGFEL